MKNNSMKNILDEKHSDNEKQSDEKSDNKQSDDEEYRQSDNDDEKIESSISNIYSLVRYLNNATICKVQCVITIEQNKKHFVVICDNVNYLYTVYACCL